MGRASALLLRLTAIAFLLIAVAGGTGLPGSRVINGWNVIERLMGRPPTGGDSWVALQAGAAGELLVVLLLAAGFAAGIREILRRLDLIAGPRRLSE